MADATRYLFGSMAQLVQSYDATDGNTGAGNTQTQAHCVSNVPMSVTVAILECSKG
jgi:hypothetical protein